MTAALPHVTHRAAVLSRSTNSPETSRKIEFTYASLI